MATIGKYQTASGATLYRVRYRTPDNRQTDKRGFTTKRDAERFLASVEVSMMRGEYVAPSSARVTVGELGPAWLDRQRGHLKSSGYGPMETAWRLRVQPRWGNVALGDIRPTAEQQWISNLGRGTSDTKPVGASVVKRTHHVLSGILADAVRDNLIARNSAAGVKLPRTSRKQPVYLTHQQVTALAPHRASSRACYCCWPTPVCGGARPSGYGCAISTCCAVGPLSPRMPSSRARRYS
jgi:Arm domain-containing DNA-binding protein